MKTYTVTDATAAALRAAAPKLGLRAAPNGDNVVELPDFTALAFDTLRKGWKVSVDTAVARVLKRAGV